MPSVSVPTAAITSLLTSAGIGTAAGAGATAGLIGADATAGLATGLTTGLEGAALGAGSSWATGGNPLLGAGIGFGLGGIGGGLAAGLGGVGGAAAGADAAAGAGAGAVPSAAAATPAIGATAVPATAAAAAPVASGAAAPIAGGTSAISGIPAGVAPTVDPTAQGVLNTLGAPSAGAVSAPAVSAPVATVTPTGGIPTNTGIGEIAGVPAYSGPPIAQPTSVQNFLDNPSFSAAGNVASQNPQAVIGALGLGYDVMHQGSVPGMGQLQNFATQEQKMAQANQSYVNTGTLPAGAQAALDQATQAAKAQVRSKYASMGMSGSTAETQDLANVDVSAAGEKFQIASQLLQAGASEANVSQQMLDEILNINNQQATATTQAISSFAASLGGSGTPLYLTQKPGG